MTYLIYFVLLVSVILALEETLKGHKLVRIYEFGPDQSEFLETIQADIWGEDADLGIALVNLSPAQLTAVEKNQFLFKNFTIAEENLAELIEEEKIRIEVSSSLNAKAAIDPKAWFKDFHRYADIKQWFEQLERTNNQLVAMVKSIGKSHEKRDIFAVHITESAIHRQKLSKPKLWLQCLIHAREWISGSVCQYLANELVSEYKSGNNPQIRALLGKAEIILVPVVNPDGYEHSWSKCRLWRKNLRGSGVDLNRNFDDHWGSYGTTSAQTSDLYCGPGPASEPETKAIQEYFGHLMRTRGRVRAAIDWHSFSQLVLRPHGWTTQSSPHDDFVRYASNFLAQGLRKNGRQYKVQRAAELYVNSGSATDYFYGQGCKYSIAVELPPSLSLTDTKGFLFPASDILPVCQEAFAGFLSFASFVLDNPI